MKYRSKKHHADGEVWDSKGEYRWFQGLRLRERAGEITDLKRQVKFDLEVNGLRVCSVILDATYRENDVPQFCDFKGVLTRDARLKYKLFEAIHGFPVRIFGAKGEVKTTRVRARKKPARAKLNIAEALAA